MFVDTVHYSVDLIQTGFMIWLLVRLLAAERRIERYERSLEEQIPHVYRRINTLDRAMKAVGIVAAQPTEAPPPLPSEKGEGDGPEEEEGVLTPFVTTRPSAVMRRLEMQMRRQEKK